MSVYDPKSLTDGISSQEALNGENISGERNLYNEGFKLEIEHVPTGYKVNFPAYLENFSDAYTQNWNAETVYGRMDPIAVYQNTSRAIAMSWNVPANSFRQAKENMDVINTLMTFMYPSYSTSGAGNVLNMSPLVRVKFLNLIHNAANPDLGLLGYINGFTVDVRSDDGVFQQRGQGLGEYTANDGTVFDTQGVEAKAPAVYPKTVTLNFELNVLHEQAMGWTSGKEGDAVLRQSDGGYPYRTDQPVPSLNNPGSANVTAPATTNSSDPNQTAGQITSQN